MCKNTVELYQELWDIVGDNQVSNFEISIVVQDVENLGYGLSGNGISAEAHHAVKDREGVAHGAIGFLGDDL